MKIGVDIEEIESVTELLNKPGTKERLFTYLEITYCENQAKPMQHYAVRFACKEAVKKALLSLGAPVMDLKDIEIQKRTDGAPFVKYMNYNIEISLSHSNNLAVAFAIIQ